MGINKLFKEFWEILRNFGALAEEFQNLVVRALESTLAALPLVQRGNIYKPTRKIYIYLWTEQCGCYLFSITVKFILILGPK